MSATMEQAVAVVRASVMIYDEVGKRWLPAGQGGQNVESKVQLFLHSRASTYRIVARKGPEHEVVLNCSLYPAMKYNQTTATFHQWRNEQRQLYGLNFVSADDAHTFGQTVARAIDMVSQAVALGNGQQMSSQNGSYGHHQHNGGLPGVSSAPALVRQQQQQPNQHYVQQTGECGIQQMTQQRTSHLDVQEQQMFYQQQPMGEAYYGVSPALHLQQHRRHPSAGSNASSSGSGCMTVQGSNLIYSTVTPTSVMPSPLRPAPPVPPPPPPMPTTTKVATGPTGVVPPAPPPPPPPPPAGMSAANNAPRQPSNLAQAISNQKLRKVASGATPGRSLEESGMSKDGRSASVGSVEGTLSTVKGGGSHLDMMSEMAATLARRRMLAESGTATSSGSTNIAMETTNSDSVPRTNEKEMKSKPWEARNGSKPSLNEAASSSTDSPRTHRKVPSGSSLSSQEDAGLSLAGGAAPVGTTQRSLSNGPTSTAAPVFVTAEMLEQWKQEILNEVKREINKATLEIIEAMKSELNHR